MKKLILAMCTASLLFSCTDDDSLSTNSAPVADNNGIEVVEEYPMEMLYKVHEHWVMENLR